MGKDKVFGFKYVTFEVPVGHPGEIARRKFAA